MGDAARRTVEEERGAVTRTLAIVERVVAGERVVSADWGGAGA
jgi:hypothetical protein